MAAAVRVLGALALTGLLWAACFYFYLYLGLGRRLDAVAQAGLALAAAAAPAGCVALLCRRARLALVVWVCALGLIVATVVRDERRVSAERASAPSSVPGAVVR